MTKYSTLRPGLLVSVKTSIRGNVQYSTVDLDPDHVTEEGSRKARWETTRLINDPSEHERAVKARSKALATVRGVCSHSAFGLLCPETKVEDLGLAIAEARKIADAFNETASLTRLSVNIIAGKIARDDVEAVRAINSEVRELLEDMSEGVKNLNVKAIREAANRVRNLGAMLSTEAKASAQEAIDAARRAARSIVKAGEQAAVEVDLMAVKAITDSRTAFLDLDDAADVATPVETGRALDLETPEETIKKLSDMIGRPALTIDFE
jgi:hypothetical protein